MRTTHYSLTTSYVFLFNNGIFISKLKVCLISNRLTRQGPFYHFKAAIEFDSVECEIQDASGKDTIDSKV
jgi:hypothetical protein